MDQGEGGMGSVGCFPTGPSTQSLVWPGLLNSGLFLGEKPACGRHRGCHQRAEGLGRVGEQAATPARPPISSLLSPCWPCVTSENIFLLLLGLIS